MLDNSRVMHGRNAFADPGRRIYVRMCQSAY
jgi:alpha-ketoglutarate-dependent taurine dioxygenase